MISNKNLISNLEKAKYMNCQFKNQLPIFRSLITEIYKFS